MKENDDKDFACLMWMMSEAFSAKISENKISGYFLMLKDLTIKQLEKAVQILLNTRTVAWGYPFPTIGEIRKVALGVEDDKMEDEAYLAWGEIKKLAIYESEERDGFFWYRVNKELDYDSPPPNPVIFQFETIRIHARASEAFKVAFGTVGDFNKRELRNEAWDRAHFIRCYKAIAKKDQRKLLLGTKPIKLLTEKGEEK